MPVDSQSSPDSRLSRRVNVMGSWRGTFSAYRRLRAVGGRNRRECGRAQIIHYWASWQARANALPYQYVGACERGSGEVYGVARLTASPRLELPFRKEMPTTSAAMGAGVFEHVQAVADVDGVDQPVADDRVAPEHHLVRPAAERRVFQRHLVQRPGQEEAGLGGVGRVGQVDGLDSAGVPVDEGKVRQRGGVVGGVAGELLGERVVAGAAAERLLILGDLVLAHDGGAGGVGDVDDPGPSP